MDEPLISETLLKKRRSLDELAYKRSLISIDQVIKYKLLIFLMYLKFFYILKKPKKLRGDATKVKRPEQYVKDFTTVSALPYLFNVLLLNIVI